MYTDEDNDGYCDFTNWSEALKKKRQFCADSIAAAQKMACEKRTRDSLAALKAQQRNGNIPLAVATNQTTFTGTVPTNGSGNSASTSAENQVNASSAQSDTYASSKSTYDVILIFSACFVLYLLTFFAARRDAIKKSTHRKIWNGLLLITFLVSGLLGLFLAIQINYDLKLNWFATLLYWHVEFGIAMAVISIFHLLWHLKYWKNIFNRPGGRIKEV